MSAPSNILSLLDEHDRFLTEEARARRRMAKAIRFGISYGMGAQDQVVRNYCNADADVTKKLYLSDLKEGAVTADKLAPPEDS